MSDYELIGVLLGLTVWAWYAFVMMYVLPSMPRYWNRRAAWLIVVTFVPALIPVELYLLHKRARA